MRDPEQKIRYNKVELGLIKGVFANNEELLYTLRKVMLQAEITEQERDTLRTLTPEVHEIIKKVFNPEIDPDAPIGQVSTLILQLGTDVKGLSPDGAWPFIQAKKLEIEYLNQQLEVLKNPDYEKKIILKELMDLESTKAQRESKYVDVVVFNWILSWVEACLGMIKALAGQKEESVEETAKRLSQNSNK